MAVITTCAQRQGVMNLPKYDKAKLHFGFMLGYNLSGFRVQLADDYRFKDSIYKVEADPNSGLNLGIISDLKIGKNFNLRFIPTLSFAQRSLNYSLYVNDTLKANPSKKIESTYLIFPIELKLKSERITNYRIYVLGGAQYMTDMVSQAKVISRDREIVKLRRNDWGYYVGLGIDFYMPYFKFAPEIKMFNGFNNMLAQDNRLYSSPLKALSSKIFLVSLTFE
ncbi:MAG: hypothetical protein RIQ89_992 [Bacteroidota bacterium]